MIFQFSDAEVCYGFAPAAGLVLSELSPVMPWLRRYVCLLLCVYCTLYLSSTLHVHRVYQLGAMFLVLIATRTHKS